MDIVWYFRPVFELACRAIADARQNGKTDSGMRLRLGKAIATLVRDGTGNSWFNEAWCPVSAWLGKVGHYTGMDLRFVRPASDDEVTRRLRAIIDRHRQYDQSEILSLYCMCILNGQFDTDRMWEPALLTLARQGLNHLEHSLAGNPYHQRSSQTLAEPRHLGWKQFCIWLVPLGAVITLYILFHSLLNAMADTITG